MKTTVGFVTLSAREHKHNYYEIIFYRNGTGKFYFSEKHLPIAPGKFIIVPPNTIHASKYDDTAETIYIKGEFKHIFSFSSPVEVFDDNEHGYAHDTKFDSQLLLLVYIYLSDLYVGSLLCDLVNNG